MNRQIRKVLLWFSLACTSTSLLGQLNVRINLDSTRLLIGDQLGVSVDFSAAAGTTVEEVKYGEWAEAGEVELLEIGDINTVDAGPPILMHQRLLLTTFDSGYHYFPPLEVVYTQNGVRDTARSGNLAMTVSTIPVVAEAPIRDNKDIIEEKLNWIDVLPYFVGVLLLVLLIVFARRLQSKKADPEKITPPSPPRPAHEIALEHLDQLEREARWKTGDIKAFQTDLTHVLRSYLENRFALPALEATTVEISTAMKKHQLDEDGKIREVLEVADMVKFAKAIPDEQVHPAGIQTIRAFVLDTRLPDVVPTDTDTTAENATEE